MAAYLESRKRKVSALVATFGAGYMLFFDSSDDEEENEIPAITTGRQHLVKVSNFAEITVPRQNGKQFKTKFRLNFGTFSLLCLKLEHLVCNTYGPKLKGRPSTTCSKQLMMTLYILANQIPFRIVAELFDVSTRTVHQSFRRVVEALLQLNKEEKIISWPCGQKALEIIDGFQEAYGFPGVLGAIDGSHIPIPAPKNDGTSYINRKNVHSINLQAVCDKTMLFTSCYAGEVGSVHDACVYRRSPLQAIMGNHDLFPVDSHLLGDAAYPLSSKLLTPFRDNGHLGEREIKFNNTLSKARCSIERAFALLKGRFRRLKMLDMRNVKFIPAVIVACCILHNVCINENDFLSEGLEEDDDVGCLIQDGCEETGGREKRNRIANLLHLL